MHSIRIIAEFPVIRYKEEVKKRQYLLRDQKETPLERAVYWTEYVLRHRGARHLQSPARDMGVIEYYLVDVIVLLLILGAAVWQALKFSFRLCTRYLMGTAGASGTVKKGIKAD